AASKSVLDNRDDPAPAAVGPHVGHIEPHDCGTRAVRREPLTRQPAQPRLLANRDCLRRRSETIAAPGLHLTEHERRSALRNDIDLAPAHAPVAVEHVVTGVEIPRCRRVFPVAPHYGARGRHSSSGGSSSTLTSLKVTTCTSATKRVGRYIS